MKVSEVGEFGLIDLLARVVYQAQDKDADAWRRLLLGIGDDAAAWYGDGQIGLATTDLLIESVHFTLGLTSWEELGWRAMAANLSDIAAMGGSPRYALVSLAVPDHTEVEDIVALYQGMIKLAQQFEVAIVGGDTSRAPLVVINITIFGVARGDDGHLLTRSAARVGDKVAVTGHLGAAAGGLEMLTKGLRFDREAATSLKKAFLQPCPRVGEGQLLLENGVRAAIDISDGLVSDLGHVCRASGVGARVEIERVPVAAAVANFGERALELAVSGGEDYELLFTASREVMDKAKAALSCPVTVIGEIVAGEVGKVTLLDRSGQAVKLPGGGWEHFVSR